MASLERQHLASVITLGGGAGAAAAVPGVGTAVAVVVNVAEVGAFIEASALFCLAVAEVHGIQIDELERRRTLLLAVLMGDRGSKLGRSSPAVQYGTKQGVLVLGRHLPSRHGRGDRRQRQRAAGPDDDRRRATRFRSRAGSLAGTNTDKGEPVKQLLASEEPLVKIFSSDYDFVIPDYQRPYSWGAEQALQLVDDLVDALERSPDEPYFLGSIVLVKEKGQSFADVIDGQQRLTTLTILLSVLRDLTTTGGLADELGRMILEPGNIVQGLDARPRLALRERDRAFFRQHIQAGGGLVALLAKAPPRTAKDAQDAIHVNAAALHRRLSAWTEQERLALVQLLGNRTYLVVVSTPDLTSAHRIFSVMNSRGLDLSPADIFKSNVIGALAGTGASEAYASRWEDAEEDLGREAFADVFLHIRMIFAQERAKRELLKEFPEQVLNQYLPDRAKEFVDDVVVPYASAYEVSRDSSYTAPSGADKVNLWFKRLNQLDNNDWRPAAMWALHKHSGDPAWLDDFLCGLERLAASMLLRRTYATPRANRYAQLLKELDAGHGLGAPALELSDEEKQETRLRLGGDLYLVTKVRKYVLLRLDEMLANNPGVTYDHALITVEHVLPQQPRSDSIWLQDFAPGDLEQWTHRLANLVLLNRAKNSEAQNFDFVEKKSRYFSGKNGVATFALTSQVLGQPTWTPQVLKHRQQALLTTLSSGWSLA